MRKLPLYPDAPQIKAATVAPEVYAADCARCELHEKARTVAMQPEGEPGGLYLIAECPGSREDTQGRPFIGESGKYLRGIVASTWDGPVAYDNGVRCFAGGPGQVKEKHVEACMPFTAHVLKEVQPTRIVALGAWGAYALLGRKPQVMSLRRAHTWWIDDDGNAVPVFITVNPAAALRNRFTAKQFSEDFRWALTTPAPQPKHFSAVTYDVETLDDARHAVAHLFESAMSVPLAIDTETSGVPHDKDFRIECLTIFAVGALEGYTWDRTALEGQAAEPLCWLFAQHRVGWAGHNLKYDVVAVMLEPLLGVDISQRQEHDSRLYRKLVSGTAPAGLDVAGELVGMGGHKDEAGDVVKAVCSDLVRLAGEPYRKALKSGKARKPVETKVVDRDDPVLSDVLPKIHEGRGDPKSYAYRFVPTGVRARYNARDTLCSSMLVDDLHPKLLARPNLMRVWDKVMKPAMRIIPRIERRGIRADITAMDLFGKHLDSEIEQLYARLRAYGDINFDSPKQVVELLYTQLKLPVLKRTESGAPSTDKEAMELLEDKHPICADLREHSHLTTIRGTFVDGMRARVHDDGRLHTTFLQDGTGPGRMSSHDPNLFNIPSPERDAKLGKMARDCFAATRGYVLIESDQSQLELRVAAMLANDTKMAELFNSGHDFHLATARMVAPTAWKVTNWDALSDELKKKYRAQAKNMNFQINYDVEPEYKLAKTVGCSLDEARRFVALVFGQFHSLRKAIDKTVALAKRHGGVFVFVDWEPANWRDLPALGESASQENKGRIRNAINSSWNTTVQGSAAHLVTRALEPVQLAFDEAGIDGHVLLTVYDSILAEVREGQVDEAREIMERIMTQWPTRAGVPLKVDTKIGHNWGSMEKV